MATYNTSTQAACTATTFHNPDLLGSAFLAIEARPIENYSVPNTFPFNPNHPFTPLSPISFCNVTVTYTHPGQGDTLHVQIWLPETGYNGRMQSIGGGGWVAGNNLQAYLGMAPAVAEGYATVTIDAGLPSDQAKDFAQVSPGNVNLYNLQNFASVSLNDAAIIGKSIVKDYYGEGPKYSYWSGCSTGGRQGLMLAQRYPNAYDGIAAAAPAINWAEFIVGDYWPLFVMNQMKEYPHPCEFAAITAAAIEACDGDDGVVDGIISEPEKCKFEAKTLVGKKINCSDTGFSLAISSAAATVAQATWTGPHISPESPLWYGLVPGSDFTWLANTSCDANGKCVPVPFQIPEDWIKLFILKNATVDLTSMTIAEYAQIFHKSVQEFGSIIGTNDPDLSEFRSRGGKMITYHGLADPAIPPGGSKNYYDHVLKKDGNAHDFYRLFFAPGLSHCWGGPGPYPETTFDALRKWVKDGVAPEVLDATSIPDSEGKVLKRPLCPYPKQQYYDGRGNSSWTDSFYCK